MEWLKEILKDVTDSEKLIEAIVKEFPNHAVLKDKFNEVSEELKTAKKTLETQNAEVEKLKVDAQTADEVKAKLETVTTEYTQYKEGEQKRLQGIQKKAALEKALIAAKASPDAIDLLIGQFDLEAMQLDEKGSITEFDKHLQPIREARRTLFGEVKTEGHIPKNTEPTKNILKNIQPISQEVFNQNKNNSDWINSNWDSISAGLEAGTINNE